MKINIHPKEKLSNIGLSKLTKSIKKDFLYSFDNLEINEDIIFINIRGYGFFCHKEDVVEVYLNKNFKSYLPKFYENAPNSHLNFGKINNKFYHRNHPDVTYANDTQNIIFINEAFRGYNGKFFENKKGLYYNPQDNRYFTEEESVVALDTQKNEYKFSCYKEDKNKYYKYASFAVPNTEWGRAPYVNETIFPRKIKERRIGVEYEFGKTFNLFSDFITNEYREKWQSVRDGSLDSIPQGIEFVSIPFKLEDLDEITDFLDYCKKKGCEIYRQCGFHVHIGASDYNFMDISALVSLCSVIEKDMFKLGGPNRAKNTYCKSLDSKFKGFEKVVIPKDKKEAGKKLYSDQTAQFERRHTQSKYVDASNHRGARYYWLNVDRFFFKRNEPEQKTVEFRNHNATFNTEDFKNYSLLCYYIVEFAKTHSKKTCLNTTIEDIVNSSQIKHRKQLINYINEKLK